MARALARKKTSGAKPRKSKAGSKSSPSKRIASAKETVVKRKPKSAEKAQRRSSKKAKSVSYSGSEATMGSRTRKSSFASPTPAPEKPPRLLSESRATSAALALLEKGIKLIYQKDFKKARQEFASIADTYPGEAEIIARARTYLQICDREEFTHRKSAAVTKDQLYTLGVMEHNRGNYDDAISYFRQSLEKHLDADYIYYSLAASQAMKNDVTEAIQNLRKAVELNEDNRVYAKNDTDFTPLHAQKEFTDLVGLNLTSPVGSAQS